MTETEKTFNEVGEYLVSLGFTIELYDKERPWGGFFIINENEASKFIKHFFPLLNEAQLTTGKLSPKILIVAPGKKLSWQYHHRRSEIWKLVFGEAAVAASDTDEEGKPLILKHGEVIQLKQGERHRLIGLDGWGVIAEIWVHTDKNNPSNEDDIVRLQDDFGRVH